MDDDIPELVFELKKRKSDDKKTQFEKAFERMYHSYIVPSGIIRVRNQSEEDVAPIIGQHSRQLRNHENRLRKLEEKIESQPQGDTGIDFEIRGFKIIIEERFKQIEGIDCIFAKTSNGKVNLTIFVKSGESINLLEKIVETLIGIHERFPNVSYDFEVEDLDVIDKKAFVGQELVLECGESLDGYNGAIPGCN